MIAALVLAAGTATRFGETKQVAMLAGKRLVRHVVDAATDTRIGRIVVVVGHDADAVADAVGGGALVVRNPRFAEGQATSLSVGLDALGEDVDAVLVLLADQPGVTARHVSALLDAAAHREEPIVRLAFADGPGPALLRRAVWDDVRELRGDVGARALFEGRPDLVFDAVVEGPTPPDIDTPADLARLERATASDRATHERPAEPGNEKPPSF